MATTQSGSLTTAQLTAIRTDVTANSDLNALARNEDGFTAMAALYNAQASPNFTVWKTALTLQQIGDAVDATELVGLSTAKLAQLQALLLFGPVNPSLPNRQAAFGQIFNGAGGVLTRTALLVIAKRFASRIEKLLSTGTGTDVSPATLQFEGLIDRRDVALALAN